MSIFKKNFYMQIIPGKNNAFGFGETEKNYEERQKNSDYSKAKGFAFAANVEEWEDFGWWENRTVSNIPKNQDNVVHRFLRSIPGIESKDEVFRFKEGYGLTLEIIKNMIHQKFFSDAPEVKVTLTLTKHQKEFVAKAQADYFEFLLFAKCRAGKSVMTLSHIIDRSFKITLVVSRYASPMQSWKVDTDKFSNFSNLVFIDINDKDYIQQIDYWYNTDKQLILWACVQSRRILDLSVDIDLLVYDEAHVGYNSAQWNKLRKATNCPVLYVTGTAYKMVWDFNDSQRYIYSYYEEQLDKMKGLNNCPSMKVILAIYESAQYQAIFGDDPDAMKNLFNVDDEGNFVHPELIQDFVTNRFATQRFLRPQNRLLKDSTHLYITLPSVAACYAFAEYMKGTRFAPIVATGDSKNDADDINKHIAENPNGSCVLTRTANVLGVTAREVDTIVNCAEGSSIEFWTQFAFRGGSSDRDWMVIDFCPQRCLESLRQTYVAACDTSPEVAEYDFTDFVSIIEWSEEFTELSADRVNEILSADVGNAIRLVSGLVTTLDFKKLRDLDIKLILKPADGNIIKSVQVNDNGGNGKGNKNRQGESTNGEKDDIYYKIDTIQSILERISLIIFHAINEGKPMNNIDSILNYSDYVNVTGDNENVIVKCLEYGIINRAAFSNRLSAVYVDIQNAMRKDDRMTLSKLSNSTQDQQDIPVELLDEMFSV